jgi:hypothetical protein
VCNPGYEGSICAHYYVEAGEPVRGHPHSGGDGSAQSYTVSGASYVGLNGPYHRTEDVCHGFPGAMCLHVLRHSARWLVALATSRR